MSFSCYCLVSTEGNTYVGFSTNVDRRLRQHNCEIQGGAKATKGKSWKRICIVTGFPDQTSALQFEWKWKNITRKIKGKSAVERRCQALLQLLNSDRSTSKAEPFVSYENPLLILVEDTVCIEYFRDKDILHGIVIE